MPYAVLVLFAIEMSFGLNGRLYSWLFERIDSLHGFRSPSRFAMIACCGIAMLAGFGMQAFTRRLSAAGAKASVALAGLVFVTLIVENANSGMILAAVPYAAPTEYNVYKAVRTLGPGVVLELPLPELDRLPGREAHYQFTSIGHWHPLVNGYAGYYPPEYVQTVSRMQRFPDEPSLAHLKNLGVRYVVVHRAAYPPQDFALLVQRMVGRAELRPYGTYPAYDGPADLYLLER